MGQEEDIVASGQNLTQFMSARNEVLTHLLDLNETSQRMTNTLIWLCPCSTALFTVGLVSNSLCMAAFMDKAFDYMPFSIHILIHCFYNVLFLLFASLRIHSFLPVLDAPPPHSTCVTLHWFYQTIDEAMATNLLLLELNRFKAVGTPDVARTKLDALRLPVILNVAALVLSTMPASMFREHTSNTSPYRNTSLQCATLLLRPYQWEEEADWIIGFIAVGIDSLIFLLLIAIVTRILIQVMRKRRRMSKLQRTSMVQRQTISRSTSMGSMKALSDPMSDFEDIYADPKPARPDPTETVCISTTGRPVVFSDEALRQRDNSMTAITFASAVSHLLCETPQRMPLPLLFHDRTWVHRVYLVAGLEILRMSNIAVEIFLFRCVSGFYRKKSDELFRIEREEPFYTDMDLAYDVGLIRGFPGKKKSTPDRNSRGSVKEEELNGDQVSEEADYEMGKKKKVILEDFTLSPDALRLQHVDLKIPNPKPSQETTS